MSQQGQRQPKSKLEKILETPKWPGGKRFERTHKKYHTHIGKAFAISIAALGKQTGTNVNRHRTPEFLKPDTVDTLEHTEQNIKKIVISLGNIIKYSPSLPAP